MLSTEDAYATMLTSFVCEWLQLMNPKGECDVAEAKRLTAGAGLCARRSSGDMLALAGFCRCCSLDNPDKYELWMAIRLPPFL